MPRIAPITLKKFVLGGFFTACSILASAQPGQSKEQQELERQRQQLKRELEQAQEMLNSNKKNTKENLSVLASINHKLNIQENMLNNISREINLMDNNISRSQRDVNKMQLLLDTLRQQYAISMVYAYKNRSNHDFLNFIFSASSFNDAIKRITYLKSYRNYREMQGENILLTQRMLRQRIDELSGNKLKKNVVLEVQSKEVDALQQQQNEKNAIVQRLKAQGKELNNQIAAKRKQMQKVDNAIKLAIKLEMEKLKKEAAAKAAAAKAAAAKTNTAAKTGTAKTTVKPTEPKPVENKSVLLATEADVTLNSNFERNRGSLPWPVGSGFLLLRYGSNKLDNGIVVDSKGISIGCDIGTTVKSVFEGEVILVNNYDDVHLVVIKHGRYFTGYSNINSVTVSKGQNVKVGQAIGKAAANLDGVGAVEFQISNENSELNPEAWLKRR
jgi:septal ring factor EnvC (AmiA/AmiB activator)